MRFIGVDPGTSGGIAIVGESGRAIMAWKMPATSGELLELLGEAAAQNELSGMVEQLGHMPRRNMRVSCDRCGSVWTESRPMQSPTTMFKMGMNYGELHMALIAAGIPFDEVLPRTWQSQYGLLRGGRKMSTTEKKNAHKAKAEQMFPQLKVTHYVADALLIAHYAWRLVCGPKPF